MKKKVKEKIYFQVSKQQQQQKMPHSPAESTSTTTANSGSTQSSLPPVPTTTTTPLHQQEEQAGQQRGEEQRQQDRCTKEKSNRHKILTEDGTARFGTIYNACPLPHKVTRPIHLTKCTAIRDIRDIKKSSTAKKNKVKIVRAEECVYILG